MRDPLAHAANEVDREHGVAGVRGGGGIVFSGRRVDEAALGVDGDAGPHRRSRGPLHLRARGVLDSGARRRGSEVGPKYLPRGDIESNDGAAEAAAGVLRA